MKVNQAYDYRYLLVKKLARPLPGLGFGIPCQLNLQIPMVIRNLDILS